MLTGIADIGYSNRLGWHEGFYVLGSVAPERVTAGATPLLPLQHLLGDAIGFCGLLTLALGYSTARACLGGEEATPGRVAHTGLTLAGAAFVAQMMYWNVLSLASWRLRPAEGLQRRLCYPTGGGALRQVR